jgi:hypothetical protein
VGFFYSMKDILLITPPFTQLNTPYPASAYLKGFLNTKSITAFQMDLGIEVILSIFSKKGLQSIFEFAQQKELLFDENSERIYALKNAYIQTIDDVIAFLQGHNNSLARQICTHNFLPQASRFDQLEMLEDSFGKMGFQDKAKHLATLYLEDLSDFIKENIDSNFGFSRYAERMGMSANSFDELFEFLNGPITYIDQITIEILNQKIEFTQPKLVCISVPFPGNLYSAFRCAQYIKSKYPNTKVAMGGGFANTELRSVNDTRVFDFFDFITLDDGELPIELLYQHVLKDTFVFKRTFILENEKVVYHNNAELSDYKQKDVGTPDYSDLFLDKYISVIEIANPMHSLWSDGRWNKLTMAHGCYWGKCTFCDVSLDYIKVYEPIAAKTLVDRIEEIIQQTGETGFHFVDEAAPPSLMKTLALEIIKRKLTITWWTNIRFEKNFTRDLCLLLKASGCIAVSGGLEVASDRLLELIQKGVTVAQVARVTQNFKNAGIMVHAYLMYGYPTQTIQETIDSLEMVRQLFELEILQSGFWHQFALTAHSPIGQSPKDYGIIPKYEKISFANNDIQFEDKTGIDHNQFSFGLKKSLYNFMYGIGLDMSLQDWFDFKIPKTSIPNNYIQNALEEEFSMPKPSANIYWIGALPTFENFKKGKEKWVKITIHELSQTYELMLDELLGQWLEHILPQLTIFAQNKVTFKELRESFEEHFEDFEDFWNSKIVLNLRDNSLLVI